MWVPSIMDYDVVIKNKLRNMRVTGPNKTSIPITVTAFSPEHEGDKDVDQKRPAVIFSMEDLIHDRTRELSDLREVVSQTTLTKTLREIPTPIKLIYQFTLTTAYQQHMSEMIQQLQLLFPMRGYISLTSPSGEIHDYDFYQKGVSAGFTNQFTQFGVGRPEREFRKIYRYHLYTEMLESMEETYQTIQDLNLDVEGMEGTE